jgi:hypothetical protein
LSASVARGAREAAIGSSMTTVFLRLRICSGVPGDCGIVVGRASNLRTRECDSQRNSWSAESALATFVLTRGHTGYELLPAANSQEETLAEPTDVGSPPLAIESARGSRFPILGGTVSRVISSAPGARWVRSASCRNESHASQACEYSSNYQMVTSVTAGTSRLMAVGGA